MTGNEPKLSRRDFLFTASQLAALAAAGPARWGVAQGETAPAETRTASSLGAAPQNLYSLRRLSESELCRMYEQLLKEACENAATAWKTATFDSRAGLWGNGLSMGNEGIRTVVSMLLGCATLLRYAGDLDGVTRRDLNEKFMAAVRFTTVTHRTGSALCTDGKPWGATPAFGSESWQSGMWTGTLAWGSWLMWDQLDTELQQRLERVIGWECDILSHRPPPNGLWLDTKAEENGWEVPCLVMGALMFSSHPHAADWQQAACRYMMNTLCTEADTHDTSIVDGRPVNEWIKGANLQPDFTLENHNIFHPAYVACSSYFLTQAVMYYTYARRPVPQSSTHHLLDTWHMFQTVILPWGESAYPQGMDWELHGLPYINLYASLATHWHDPLAAHFEQCSLQYLRKWQAMGAGSLAIPGSRFGIARHAINVEQASYGFLAHKIFGAAARPISSGAATAQEEGVRDYPYVDFIAHRSRKKFVSFSWKNRIMGLLVPLGEGHEGNPDFSVPIQNGFVGSFEVNPAGEPKEKIIVVEHSLRKTGDGFETDGTLLLHSGRLKQKIKMTSIGNQTVIYEDEVTALADVTIIKELGIPIGIENDEITGGTRVVTTHDMQTVVKWQDAQPLLMIPGNWVNIDNRLGVVTIAGSGMSYASGSGYLPGIAVCCDTLWCSYSDNPRTVRAGEIIFHRLAIFYVEVTPQKTEQLARSCAMGTTSSGAVLRFLQPDGSEHRTSISFGPSSRS